MIVHTSCTSFCRCVFTCSVYCLNSKKNKTGIQNWVESTQKTGSFHSTEKSDWPLPVGPDREECGRAGGWSASPSGQWTAGSAACCWTGHTPCGHRRTGQCSKNNDAQTNPVDTGQTNPVDTEGQTNPVDTEGLANAVTTMMHKQTKKWSFVYYSEI